MFIAGFLWMTILLMESIENPHIYNGVDGFRGFLLGTNTYTFFYFALIFMIVGGVVLLTEVFVLGKPVEGIYDTKVESDVLDEGR